MQPKRHRPLTLTRLAPLLLATLVVAVPLAYFTAPAFERWTLIRGLASPDAGKRNRALMYVATYAHEDERVLAGAVKQLPRVGDDGFVQIVDALQSAACWDREYVTDSDWLRWIVLQAETPGVEAPALAARRLAQLHDLADDPRVISLLLRLAGHDEPDVRYNAMCAAAELALSAKILRPHYIGLLFDRQADSNALIARHAAIVLYLLGEPGAAVPGWVKEPVRQEVERYGLEKLRRLLGSPQAPLRDVGCVLAVRDLPVGLHGELISELLSDENPEAQMSGAVLAGITGERLDLLRDTIDKQNEWSTATTLKLGLWIADPTYADELDPAALLAREDIPRSTVILAMLHGRDYRALDALFNPHGEAPDDLAYLLEGYGWWRVLDRYLPEDAPRWRPRLDEDELRWQVDLLRDWYLMRRHQLTH